VSSLAVDRRLRCCTSILPHNRVATDTAFTELSAALWRQIANVSEQTGFYARLVRHFGAAKTEGVTRACHIGAGAGSANGQTQHHAEQRSQQAGGPLDPHVIKSSASAPSESQSNGDTLGNHRPGLREPTGTLTRRRHAAMMAIHDGPASSRGLQSPQNGSRPEVSRRLRGGRPSRHRCAGAKNAERLERAQVKRPLADRLEGQFDHFHDGPFSCLKSAITEKTHPSGRSNQPESYRRDWHGRSEELHTWSPQLPARPKT